MEGRVEVRVFGVESIGEREGGGARCGRSLAMRKVVRGRKFSGWRELADLLACGPACLPGAGPCLQRAQQLRTGWSSSD